MEVLLGARPRIPRTGSSEYTYIFVMGFPSTSFHANFEKNSYIAQGFLLGRGGINVGV